jgi:PAS domain S-box-containing protein
MTDANRTAHILVVDDDMALRRLTVAILTSAGYVATPAANGAEALRLAAEQRPDLVLLDVGLPDINGMEVCRRLKADPATADIFVILFSSTNTDAASQVAGLEGGADGYITRPIANRELLARVRATLRLQQAEAALRQANARLQAELAARVESEARLRVVTENTYAWEFWIGPDETFLYCAPSCERLTGYTAAEFIARPSLLHEMVHPDDRPIWDAYECRAAAGDQSGEVEFRIVRPDGGVRWLAHVCYPGRAADGRPWGRRGSSRDITERQEAAQQRELANAALRDSEAQFRALAEMATSAIVIYQGESLCYANPAAEQLTGYSAQELVRMRFWEVVHPEDRALVRERGLARQRGEAVRPRYTFRVVRRSGETRWVDFTAGLIQYHGRPAGLGTAFDITELVQAQEAEREQRLLAEALRDTAAALASPLGFDAMLNRILEAVGRVMPHDAANVLLVEDGEARVAAHRGYEGRADEAQLRAVRLPLANTANLRRMMETGRPLALPDTRNEPAWVDMSATRWICSHAAAPIRVKGNCIGFLSLDSATPGFFTQEKADRLQVFADQAGIALENAQLLQAMQDELAERQRVEEMLRTVLDTIPQRVFWKDRNSVLLGVNRAYLQDHGLRDATTIVGKHDSALFPRDIGERFEREDQQIIATDTPLIGFEEYIPRPDKTPRWLRTSKAPLHGPDGAVVGVLGTYDDITEEKLAQAKLQSTLAELARSNAELEQFAYAASHDLQEPLRMVASFVRLLADRYQGQLDSDADEFIEFAVDGARRMQALISDLLEYSRVTTRGQPPQPTDAAAVLAEALWNLGLAIAEAGATVTHDPLPTVLADPTQLMRLFQNLIGNALKFRSAAPPVVHVSVELRNAECGIRNAGQGPQSAIRNPQWLFSVRDNGIGIDPQNHARIFGVFQRLHTRQEYPGTGIGLAICQKIVERHGGRIWVASQEGQGATFYFTLPAA